MRTTLLAACLAMATAACGGGGDDDPTLYQNLGGAGGIRAVVDDTLDRAYDDPKINGYFLNLPVDRAKIADCLVAQIGAATGGPQTYPSGDCRSMAAAHQGMGVSTVDFDDFLDHLDAALAAADVADADAAALRALLEPHRADIVEDEGNNATVYQRVGRKPAIAALVDAFVDVVGADARINAFFQFDHSRTKRCLTRLVCSIDGPCLYGEEIDHPAEEPLSALLYCRDMATSHDGLTDTSSNPILVTHFTALVEDLVTAMTDLGVTSADQAAVAAVLGPMCADIVSDPQNCPASAAGPRPRRPGRPRPDATSAATPTAR
jgi:hemoglobin